MVSRFEGHLSRPYELPDCTLVLGYLAEVLLCVAHLPEPQVFYLLTIAEWQRKRRE